VFAAVRVVNWSAPALGFLVTLPLHGTGLRYAALAAALAGLSAVALRATRLGRVVDAAPEAVADDLVGLRLLRPDDPRHRPASAA
jgi:MFS superfamily sulfate permease-like transporter